MNHNTTRVSNYVVNNTTFRVMYGDITNLKADALVSSDDTRLTFGGRGVAHAILKAGGNTILEDAKKHVPLNVGDVVVTTAGKLPAKYIFHAVTIEHPTKSPSVESIRAATKRSLKLADALSVRTIAFPALGAGTGGAPLRSVAEIMTSTIAEYLVGKTEIELVILTLFSREITAEIEKNLFYEQAAGGASVLAQSNIFKASMVQLGKTILDLGIPDLNFKRTQTKFEKSDFSNPKGLEKSFENIAKFETKLARKLQSEEFWRNKQTKRDEIARARAQTRRSRLKTQLNIYTKELSDLEREKVKLDIRLRRIPIELETKIEQVRRDKLIIEQELKSI